ncbi:hypothetical protein AJ87_19765 [Rhizobium yanglingense]|nr:hypothetical protein AJ87_19765 [Rhizobium yanglingense]
MNEQCPYCEHVDIGAKVCLHAGGHPQQARRCKGRSTRHFELRFSVQTCNEERALQRAAEVDKIRLDKTWASAGANGAVRRACPSGIGTICGTNGHRVHTVRRHLYPVETKRRVPFSVISDSDRRQSIVSCKTVVEHRSPRVDVVIFDRKMRSEAYVDQIELLAEKCLINAVEHLVKPFGILAGVGVENTIMLNRRVRPR